MKMKNTKILFRDSHLFTSMVYHIHFLINLKRMWPQNTVVLVYILVVKVICRGKYFIHPDICMYGRVVYLKNLSLLVYVLHVSLLVHNKRHVFKLTEKYTFSSWYLFLWERRFSLKIYYRLILKLYVFYIFVVHESYMDNLIENNVFIILGFVFP